MLFPQHPKPVERRRAVAELSVAYQQAAAIAPGHVVLAPDVPQPAAGLVANAAVVAPGPAIAFPVPASSARPAAAA